jgi:hypothetical protein
MKRIHYSDAVVLTSDAAADAVMDYATALATRGAADTVNIPTVDDDGFETIVRMLIGPASQMVVEPAPDDELEPESRTFVADVRNRIERMRGQ